MISSIEQYPLYKTDKISRESFCKTLLARMTLEEKVGQMVQADLSWDQDVEQLVREGRIGSLLSILDTDVINRYKHIAVEESRLHIPLLMGNDIIHGYRTIFPIPLALANSWNPALVEAVARASIAEAIACGTTWNFAPVMDVSRDPRWGRIAETAGEDTTLIGRIGAAWVKGFQSYEDEQGHRAAACVKHFAAYGGVESGKDYNTVDMSERRLREEYLPPYLAAIQAGALTLMTSFNELNGIPATINPLLLRTILRQEWNFNGVVISDYDAIGELLFHGVAQDHKEAAYRSILAGIDIDMMGNGYHFHLAELVREGMVAESMLDDAVLRILQLKYELGLFEQPYVAEQAISSALQKSETMELAAKAAAESIVLLKNNSETLPLKPAGKTIALIGPLAEERQSLLGCWHFDGRAEEVQTVHEVLQQTLPADCRLIVSQGCSLNSQENDFSEALAAANQADIILLALGEPDTLSGEAHCRATLGLPGEQQALVNAIAQSGKPMVACLFAGRPLAIPELVDQVDALIMAWHGGTKAAQGLVDVLLGKINPSGKIAACFPRSVGQVPIYYAHKNTGRPFDSTGTIQFNQAHKSIYLDESNLPLFPFGFGLSYTSFTYSDMQISESKLDKNGTVKISALVSNTGKIAGTEVVQLYIRDLVAKVTRPVKELKDFRRIPLQAGEQKRVYFEIPCSSLVYLDVDLSPILENGSFQCWIGPNAAEGLQGTFEVI
jgi:beta-glucosidase